MSRSLLRTLLTSAAIIFYASRVSGQESLCNSVEHTYFSCALSKSSKLVSICGSQLDAQEKYLQYRYGKTNKIELTFPRDGENPKNIFYYSEYIRPNLTKQSLRGINNNYQYQVYMEANTESAGGNGEADVTAELRVSGKGKTTVLRCKSGTFKGIDNQVLQLAKCDDKSGLPNGMCIE